MKKIFITLIILIMSFSVGLGAYCWINNIKASDSNKAENEQLYDDPSDVISNIKHDEQTSTWLEAYACDEEAGQEGSLFLNKMVVLIGEENILVTFGQEKDDQITCYNEYEITNYNNNAFDHYVINKITQTETGRIYNVYLDFETVDRAIDVVVTGNQLEFVDPILTKVEIPQFIDYDGKLYQDPAYYVSFLKDVGALADKYEDVSFESYKYVDSKSTLVAACPNLFNKSVELTGYAVLPGGTCNNYRLLIEGFCEPDQSYPNLIFANAVESALAFDWSQIEINISLSNPNALMFTGFVPYDLKKDINEEALYEITGPAFRQTTGKFAVIYSEKLIFFTGELTGSDITFKSIDEFYYITSLKKTGLSYTLGLVDYMGRDKASITMTKMGSNVNFTFDNLNYTSTNYSYSIPSEFFGL